MTLPDATLLIHDKRVSDAAPQQWADIGCGKGLFSKALLQLLHRESVVYAIDKQPVTFKEPNIQFLRLDIESQALPLPPLHGLVMANSLHFVKDQLNLLRSLHSCLLPGGLLVLVEYNTDRANRWVPDPLSFPIAARLLNAAGFEDFECILEHPSIYHRANIYGACGNKKQTSNG